MQRLIQDYMNVPHGLVTVEQHLYDDLYKISRASPSPNATNLPPYMTTFLTRMTRVHPLPMLLVSFKLANLSHTRVQLWVGKPASLLRFGYRCSGEKKKTG